MSDFLDFEPHICIQGEDSSSGTLFFFPQENGGGESYLGTIVPELGTQSDLILFNNYYLHLNEFKPDMVGEISLEFLAKLQLGLVKIIQPTGPYNFFGWSAGGIVAFEVCRQLLLQGDTVSSLIIVDSCFALGETLQELGLSPSPADKIFGEFNPDPIPSNLLGQTNVVLMKGENGLPNDLIATHYAQNIKYNKLDQFIPSEYICVHPIVDHINWIKSKENLSRLGKIISATINHSQTY